MRDTENWQDDVAGVPPQPGQPLLALLSPAPAGGGARGQPTGARDGGV